MAIKQTNIFPIDLQPRNAVGIAFPFSSFAVSGSATPFKLNYTTKDQIKSNLIVYFSTNKGERPLNPNYGGGLKNILFEQLTSNTANVVEKIIKAIEKHSIPMEDLLIDPLAMTVGADPDAVNITLETVHLIKEKFGLNMSMGASNVSFGLPNRHAVNSAFLPMAMAAGLTSAIMDSRTAEIVASVRAADLLLGYDQWGANWITRFRQQAVNA